MRSAPLALSFMGALLLVAGLSAPGVPTRDAAASHGGADAFSIDMNTTGNAATSLGPLDPCVSASAGSTVTVDITATNIPAYVDNPPAGPGAGDTGGITGWEIEILYNETALIVQRENPDFLVANNAGSSLAGGISEPTPDTDGTNSWLSGNLDISSSTPEQGSGVLTRLTIEVDPAAVPGLYNLEFDRLGPPPNAVHLDGSSTGAFAPHDLSSVGTIAVGQACPAAATPIPTAAPTAAPTATGAPGATPTPSPAPVSLPPTGGGDDGSGGASPLYLVAMVLLLAMLGYGAYGVTRRTRTQA